MIQPKSVLQPGSHCLVQGDMRLSVAQASNWCFIVSKEDGLENGATDIDLETELPADLHGFHLVVNGETKPLYAISLNDLKRQREKPAHQTRRVDIAGKHNVH